MNTWICVFLLVDFVTLSGCKIDDSQGIPPIHAMDDFNQCKSNGDTFCRIQFSLRPNTQDGNKAWQIIQSTKNNPRYFNRDTIYRFRCVSKNLDENIEEIGTNVTMNENMMLQKLSLNARVDDMECASYSKESLPTRYDYTILYSTLGWLGFIALATLCDVLIRTIPNWKGSSTHSSTPYFVRTLSLWTNWKELLKPVQNEDYQKISCIQGIRTFNMAAVVIAHTILNALVSFTADTNYIEEFYRTAYTKYIVNSGLLLVQTNFLISAWLLASKMHSYLEKHEQLTIRDALNSILMRYLRILPALMFLICWEMSNWPQVFTGGPKLERFEMNYRACQKNWWATLLLVNNFFLSSEMCNLGTWYLSNDFQLFILAIILFYFIANFKITDKIIIWTMAFFWSVHAFYIYSNHLGVIFDFTPENAKVENSVGSFKLIILYTSLYSNYASYAVGLLFGGLYYKYKYNHMKVTKKITCYWLLIFCSLPLSAVYFSMFEYSRLQSAIIGASLKPIFSLGIGIGIFGMTHGVGGIVKKFCESKIIKFLSKWTYSIYIIHFPIVFGRYAMMNEPVHLNRKVLIISMASDVIQSFAAGLLLHLVIERPFTKIVIKFFTTESSKKIKSG